MALVPAIDQVQYGTESAWGTAVAGTAKAMLIESCDIEPEVEVETLMDVRASLAPGYVNVLNSHKGGATLNGWPTYEDIGYALDSLLMLATPTGGPVYVRAYTGQLGTVPTRRIRTLIKGQTDHVQKMSGAITTEYNLKIESNKPWKFSEKLIGKAVSDGTLASLSDRTVTPIHANDTLLYIDAEGGTIGATVIPSLYFAIDLDIKNNTALVPGISSLTPLTYVDAPAKSTLKLTMDVVTATAGYLTSILGSSLLRKQIRIKAASGTSIAQFDFAGTFSSAPTISREVGGVRTYEFELEALYNATLGNWLKASNSNGVATLA